MDIRLETCRPSLGDSFRPSDTVNARVLIRGGVFDKRSKITAVLQGKLLLDVTPQPCGPNPGQLTRKFLRIEETINLDDFDSVNLDEGELTYAYPLQFRLPSVSPCHHCDKPSPLPPSLDLSSSRFRIRSEYAVTVSAQRSFLGVLPKSTSVRQVLPVTADPPSTVMKPFGLPTPLASPLPSKAVPSGMPSAPSTPSSSREMRIDQDDDDYFQQRESSPPSYSPPSSSQSLSLPQVQIITPGPLVLVRGQDIPLQLMVHLPRGFSNTSDDSNNDVYLRGGTISFRQSATACMGPTPHHTTQSYKIFSWDDAVRVQGDDGFLLDPSRFGSRIATPAAALPNYKSCLLRTEAAVEVEVKVSLGRHGKTQSVRSRMDVVVADAPPAYGDRLPPAFELQPVN